MKRVAQRVALAMLALLSIVWLGLIGAHGQQGMRAGWAMFGLKVSGRASYLSWSQVLWYFAPSGLRPPGTGDIQRLTACSRVSIRSVQQRSEPCGTQWETPLGPFWADRGEGDLLAYLVHEVLWEAAYHRPPVAVRRGDVVIDGGAHIGVFIRSALSRGARKVVAFEPDPRNSECLQRNFQKELSEGKVVLVRKALWSSSMSLDLRRGLNSAQTRVGERTTSPSESIPATTIDDAVGELNLDRVDFIKLDIEGAERHAMAGAARTLRRFGPRMVLCSYHLPDDPVKITEVVLRLRPSYWVFATATQQYFYEGGQGRP